MRPNDYDRRQARLMKRVLEQALLHLDCILIPGRDVKDIKLRAMSVSGGAAGVSMMAKRMERRFAEENA